MTAAIVTGPSSGIVRVAAQQSAGAGFHVIAAGRSLVRIQPVLDLITAREGTVEYLQLDLASLTSVRTAAARILESGHTIEVLVNHAGIGVNRRGRTADGFEIHFGINHLGHFLLTDLLRPAFRPGARVVSVASSVHFRADGIDFGRLRSPTRFTGYPEYATSKLANILFTRELARREPDLNTYAVHPGLVDTRLIPFPVKLLMRPRLLTPEQGADSVVWCATATEVAGVSGRYYQRRAVATPSPQAEDDDLARALWQRSAEWCS